MQEHDREAEVAAACLAIGGFGVEVDGVLHDFGLLALVALDFFVGLIDGLAGDGFGFRGGRAGFDHLDDGALGVSGGLFQALGLVRGPLVRSPDRG